MTINQLSIFIENKNGTLLNVLEMLRKEGIQIIASTISDTSDFGIYRMICNDSTKAYNVFRAHNMNAQLTDVLGIQIDDKPGAAADVVGKLTNQGVAINYMYSFILNGKGLLIIKANPLEKAKEVIMLNKIGFITESDLRG